MTRHEIIEKARKNLASINQIFIDAEYWNTHTRPKFGANTPPIDPDPDGMLVKMRADIELMLANEIQISEPKHLD